MDNNTITGDELLHRLSAAFGALAWAAVLICLVSAIVAYLVAPDDRPWSFFWCTLLFLGPLGIVLAVIAPARPAHD
jgi:hypothetical protein